MIPSPDAPVRNLSSEEIRTYREEGVVVARGLFSEAWLSRMEHAVDRIVAEPTIFGRAVSMKEEGFTGDLFVWKLDDDFRDWIYQSPASLIAQQVLGAECIRHFYDQLFVKPPGCHVPTPWHHDITFWPVDVDSRSLCSIWLTFDAVTRESSGLEFVKGSHRWPNRFKAVTPNYDPYMMDSDFEDPPDIDGHRDDYDLFCPEMQRGDCLIFDAHILHGSSSNYSTEQSRRAFSSRWVGDEVRFDPRHATMPLLWRHGLEAGDSVSGSLFPQILPEPIEAEGAIRARGPEQPDLSILQEIAAASK
jgi:ectoine hydroxylase-related dioxygenase (phytanoyl-CoA dioxygenase family)